MCNQRINTQSQVLICIERQTGAFNGSGISKAIYAVGLCRMLFEYIEDMDRDEVRQAVITASLSRSRVQMRVSG